MRRLPLLFAVLLLSVLSLGQIMVIHFANGDVLRFDASEIASITFENEKPVNVFEYIAGTWKGDKGLEMVEISADGTAEITCVNGFSWTTRVAFADGRFSFEAPTPISAEYYSNYFSPKLTEQLVAKIKIPDRWNLVLSSDGKDLAGRKSSVTAYYSGDTLSSWNYAERDSAWEKLDTIAGAVRPIVGTWKGDKGINTVEIFANGTAKFTCMNDYSWKTLVDYKDGHFIFKTPFPAPLGYNTNYFTEQISQQLAGKVDEPNTWTLALSNDGKKLEGRKTIQWVTFTGDTIDSVEDRDREAIWERIN